jgi:hypothetical protein
MRFFCIDHVYRLKLSIIGDMANRLVLHPARVVHFHLKTYFTPKNKIRQDLSEEAFNHPSLTVPIYHPLSVPMDEPLHHTQSRQSL